MKKILKSSSLRLFYCKEDFYLGDRRVSSAVHPMVSFSEFEIATIDKRKITYGMYGIAFKKSWVDKNKLHPVLYVDKNSIIANSLANLLAARRKRDKKQLARNVKLAIMTIKCFTKNANGYNSYFDIKNFDFKSEEEWRYVPKKNQIGGKLISQDKSKYMMRPDYYNNQLKDYSLIFSANDIEYIFVSNEYERQIILKLFPIDRLRIKISNWST